MTDKYDEILKKAKQFNYSVEKYNLLEEIMIIARRAKLPLRKVSELEIKDEIRFAASLTGAATLYESYKSLGDEGYIVYMNEKSQIVHHYVDGRIKLVNEIT